MKFSMLPLPNALLLGLIPAFLLAGCGKNDDPIAKADKKDVAVGVPAPGIAETKAIAEEAYIYAFPMIAGAAPMTCGSLRSASSVVR